MSINTTKLQVMRELPVVKRKRPWLWVQIAAVSIAAALVVASLLTNPGYDWGTVGEYLFNIKVLRGIGITLQLTLYSMIIGLVLGVILAVLRQSPAYLPRQAAALFIWFFRGTPLLVQLLFWGFAAALYPRIAIGIPFGPEFISWDTNTVIPFFVAAVLGLGLNEAAYMAEIVRGGLLSVPRGQDEAAGALGLSNWQRLRFVILPQAMRVIIPPIGNQTIGMLKMTSVVLIIGVQDLLGAVTQIYALNYRQIPLLIVASLWYLLMTTILSFFQRKLERRMSRGVAALGGI